MRTLLIFIIAAAFDLAIAHSDLETIERALGGDMEALDRYLEESGDHKSYAFVAAHGYRAAGQDERAIELLQQAAREGFQPALWALVFHYVERHDWIDAYAWGRLAMLVEKFERDEEIDEEQWPLLWSWQATQQAARNLRDNEYPEADALTERIVADWYPLLTTDRPERDPATTPVFLSKNSPRFPRDIALAGESGWVVVMLDFLDDGTVRRVLPVAFTHNRFARRAEDAIEDWVIDTERSPDWAPSRAVIQSIEFSLHR